MTEGRHQPARPLRAILAEDEALLAEALRLELARSWPSLQVVAVARNGQEALEAILTHRPDIAFLDIRMPVLSGIEVAGAMLEDWPQDCAPPLLVFVTAYDEFAIEAFRHAAVDYLLKPVEPARLDLTVQRLRQRLGDGDAAADHTTDHAPSGRPSVEAMVEQFQLLLQGAASGGQSDQAPLRVIRAAVGDSVQLIPVDQIHYLQALDKYVQVVSSRGEALLRQPLRELLARLDPTRFVQIHRGTVVNLERVIRASRDDHGRLMLTLADCSERLVVSRLYAHHFKPM